MRIGISLAWLAGMLVGAAAQAELYRYVDGNGGVVLSRHGVPAELIGNGYEVLSEQGRLLRVVPPAPTPAQRVELRAREERAALDAKLLRLYSSVEDVERARLRKLAELDGLIDIAEANLQALQAQRRQRLEREQVDPGRRGAGLTEHDARLASDEAVLQQQMAHYRELRMQAQAGFARDAQRLAELLDTAR